jgi:hypothetical protein
MKGVTVVAVLVSCLLLAGCLEKAVETPTENEDVYDGSIFTLDSHGGIAQTRQVLVVDPLTVTYDSYAQGGKVIAHAQRALSDAQYHTVVNAFRDNRFLELNANYTGPPIADGTTETLQLTHGKEVKTVTINPYSPDAMTEDIAAVDKAMRTLIGYATEQVVPLG